MLISLQTKCTTACSLVAGAISASLNPTPWLTGFAIGIVAGNLVGTSQEKVLKNGPSHSDMPIIRIVNMFTPINEATAAINLSDALPGLITTGLNLWACALLISKVSLPIIGGILSGLGALLLGFTLSEYFCLQRAELLAQHTQNQKALIELHGIVL